MTNDPLLKNVGGGVGQWWHGARKAFQAWQSSIAGTFSVIPQSFDQGQLAVKNRLLKENELSEVAGKPLPDAMHELNQWRKNPAWVDEKAILEVSVPKGALCQLNSIVKVGIPPKTVFDILSDPENKRVFKDIQEVRHRKVLEDYGERKIIELEQAAIWRFLWLSGVLSVFVKVDQDRNALSLKYELGKEGFMKRFQGSWNIEPLYVDVHKGPAAGRVASLVRLQQVVEPSFMPPPPISWYVRGITTKTMEKLLGDLQAEGKRLRESSDDIEPTTEEMDDDVGRMEQQRSLLHRSGRLSIRASGASRRNRKKRWKRINLFDNMDTEGAEHAEGI